MNLNFPISAADPSYVVYEDGSRMLVFRSTEIGGHRVRGQLYTADGVATGPIIQISEDATTQNANPKITALTNGQSVVVWVTADKGLSLRLLGADGSPLGQEQSLSPRAADGTTVYTDISPVITALGDGGFVAVWASEGADGSDRGVLAQRFTADGIAVDPEPFLVNQTTATDQHRPDVIELQDGGFVISWDSIYGVSDNDHRDGTSTFAKIYNAD